MVKLKSSLKKTRLPIARLIFKDRNGETEMPSQDDTASYDAAHLLSCEDCNGETKMPPQEDATPNNPAPIQRL